ncbi:MAG TPA: pyruvate dehydrogenase complex dihydrolipoamide acetyltransferase [Saprospiraceae bacterium]|nr:pyruvate dehydrogenase complex dihydrolipoamide acetyltransferase [Saprospiraceae bacterium]
MAEIIRMPRLSDTMEEGNIVAWLKKVGDKVSPGDILAEVETDKATMELESFNEGYLLYISVEKGPVPVNEILAVIGAKDEDYKSLLSSAPKSESSEKTPPAKKEEEPEKKEEESTEKETAASESTPVKPESKQEETKTQPSPTSKETESSKPEATPGNESRIKSSPLAKTIAADAGIDIASLKGSGDGGRIIKRDVENFVLNSKTQAVKSNGPSTPQYGEFPLSQMRKTIARRLVESKFSAPHFYLTIKITMDKTMEARKLINEQSGLKISINDFVIKGCAVALRMHPAINSSWLGDKIRVNQDINIGVAVAVEDGLLVPVLFGADQMGLNEMNTQINTLADKARQKKLQVQEMQGNTFTVSNLGMFGIDEFTAIINPPDAAILAIGTIAQELHMVDGKVSSSNVMKVTMSCDHRVVDGATGAKFLQTFKQLLENPVAMLV